jgi:4-diphosphocytidyl-2-C-methyl-D-erythritol kinase
MEQQSKAEIASCFLLLLRYYVIFEHDHQSNDQYLPISAICTFRAPRMNFRAYGKINIGLRILRKRSDGYHDIETVFHQIDLYDELSIEPADSVILKTSSSGIPTDAANLCVRAAELFRQNTGFRKGVEIQLKKNIPVGAGLGGGSSNAASILVALNTFWNIGMERQRLESIASQLGSDVPFFLQGGTAAGTSRGEILEHFHLNIPYWMITATPSIHISTAWAYANVKLKEQPKTMPLRILVERSMDNPVQIRTLIQNDFEQLVFQMHPQIRILKEKLESAGAFFAQLSGSGSSVFGLFRDESAAKALSNELALTCKTSLTAPGFQVQRNPSMTIAP